MSIIDLNLPPGAKMTRLLKTEYEPDELDQDILQIRLANGFSIDVGYWPEYEREGRFRVVGFRDHWDDQIATCEVKTPGEVAAVIEALARHFSAVQQMETQSNAADLDVDATRVSWNEADLYEPVIAGTV